MIETIADFLYGNGIQFGSTFAILFLYFILDRICYPKIIKGADHSRFKDKAVNNAVIIARAVTAMFGILLFIIIWGVDLTSILVFATTAITLLGVALFASWSVLSNITAFFILLLHPSFRRGYFIRIMDMDNYIEGYISDITVFNTQLTTESRETVIYPNNLLLSKPCLINPRNRRKGIGKIGPELEEVSLNNT